MSAPRIPDEDLLAERDDPPMTLAERRKVLEVLGLGGAAGDPRKVAGIRNVIHVSAAAVYGEKRHQ